MRISITIPGAAAAALLLGFAGCSESGSGPGAGQRAFTPTFSATNAQVLAFLAKSGGGAKAKLAFVDRTGSGEVLSYVDFSEGGSAIHAIKAAKGAKVPVISPDGKWIAYATGAGAEAGSPPGAKSEAWIVKMEEGAQPVKLVPGNACEPRFDQDALGGNLAIVYGTESPDLAWEGHGMTMRVEVDVSGGTPVAGAPLPIFPGGSFLGGISRGGKYLCGGGGHVAMLDLVGDKAKPETLSLGGIQACNASISASLVKPGALMYLNTQGQSPAIDGGKSWEEWQTILISDASRRLLKGYTYPAAFANPIETTPASVGRVKWHHCEWSNHPHFAAATLNVERFFQAKSGFDNMALQERIYLIDLKDSTYLEVLRPDAVKYTGKGYDVSGLYWPWLWVEVPAGFKETPTWLDAAI